MLNFCSRIAIVAMTGAAVLCLPSAQARAQAAPFITGKDLEVAVRAFSFVYGMPKGQIEIEIVYDPASAASAGEAQHLGKIIGSGGEFANRSVKARMVQVAQMGSTGNKIAYVTHGLSHQYDTLLAKATAEKILTFSKDFQCVDSQKCVMGVESSPAIKMEISRSATEASGLEFSQAMKLMVKEVE